MHRHIAGGCQCGEQVRNKRSPGTAVVGWCDLRIRCERMGSICRQWNQDQMIGKEECGIKSRQVREYIYIYVCVCVCGFIVLKREIRTQSPGEVEVLKRASRSSSKLVMSSPRGSSDDSSGAQALSAGLIRRWA